VRSEFNKSISGDNEKNSNYTRHTSSTADPIQSTMNAATAQQFAALLLGCMAISVSAYTTRKIGALPKQNPDNILTTREPHKLKNGRGAFLGFRNTKDALQSSTGALMPDGGISPCVIRVLGVGGGGCNAVSLNHGTSAVSCVSMAKLDQHVKTHE
jgi:hypothetical protein